MRVFTVSGRKSFKEGQHIKTLVNKTKKPTNQPTKKDILKRQKQNKNKNKEKKQLIELFLECFACQ